MLLPQSNRTREIRDYLTLIIGASVVVVLDQTTKLLVARFIIPYSVKPIIPGIFALTHIENPGIAFGQFPQWGRLFTLVSAATILIILYVFRLMDRSKLSIRLAFCLLLGGALGNLIDRVRLGHIIDFLDFHIHMYRWPSFNIADSAVCVGVAILILTMMFDNRKPPKAD